MLIRLFIVAALLGGFGGAAGSILGNAAGRTGLWIGGIVGGLLGATAAAMIAKSRRWIRPDQLTLTIIGAMVGFLAAAGVAVNTLFTPLGPIGSTLLIGAGAVLGAKLSAGAQVGSVPQ